MYHIVFAFKNNNPITQQIAKIPVLFAKKMGEKSAKIVYKLQDKLIGFLLQIYLHTISTLRNQ